MKSMLVLIGTAVIFQASPAWAQPNSENNCLNFAKEIAIKISLANGGSGIISEIENSASTQNIYKIRFGNPSSCKISSYELEVAPSHSSCTLIGMKSEPSVFVKFQSTMPEPIDASFYLWYSVNDSQVVKEGQVVAQVNRLEGTGQGGVLDQTFKAACDGVIKLYFNPRPIVEIWNNTTIFSIVPFNN